MRLDDELVRFELRTSERRDRRTGLDVRLPSTQLRGLAFGEDVTFTLEREAGVFTFEGRRPR